MEQAAEEEGATGVAEFNVTALAQVSDANPYCTLANFEIEKKIGQGQFSAVFRAKCKINQQQVALKKVKIFEMMDAKSRQDCIREIGTRLLEKVKNGYVI